MRQEWAEPAVIAEPSQARRTGQADTEVGSRIRRARVLAKLSQEELADRIGISCQQLQKYEVAANRVSVARLIDIAAALNVDVVTLLREVEPAAAIAGVDLQQGDVLRLMRSFFALRNQASRLKIIELAEFLEKIEAPTQS